MPAVSVKTQRAAEADVSNQGAQQASANASNASAKDEQMTQNAPQYVTAEVYKVKTGDSFWAIAEKFNVPGGYKFLAEYNGMTPKSVIHTGDKLNIPKLNDSAQANNATADAPVQAPAQANNAPANAPAQANNAPANAPAQANSAPANAPAQANNAQEGELDLPTKCPLEQLLEEHPEITTNQQLISYFYKKCGKSLSKAYDYARSLYSVEIDDLTSNRKGAINLEKPKAVFANRNTVFSYIVSNLGMSNAGACGVLANMQSESNFDTTCVGDKGTSYGLCQWHDDRKKKLIKFCLDNGYDLNSFAGQLEYLASELASTYPSVHKAMKNAPNTEKGAYDAAYKWCVDFESPKDEVSKGKQRGEVAKSYFQTYGNVSAKPKTEKTPQHAPAALTRAAFFEADEAAEAESAPVVEEPVNETEGNAPAEALEGNEVASAQENASENKHQTSGYIETSDNTVNEIQKAHPNGITVTLYGGIKKDSAGTKGYDVSTNNREFTSLATGTASYTNTVDSKLNMASAMMANSSGTAKNLTNKVYNTLHERYKQAKPASAEEEPEHLKIKNLSLYYHGTKNSIVFPGGSLGSKSVDSFVNDIRGALRNDVRVQLFACSTASTKNGENNFAKTMAEALGGEARVYGHETPGPATENANARYYDGKGNATSMFDALMPADWIKEEAIRIWGPNYSPEAYDSLTKKLKTYYEGVCGLPGSNWESSIRKDFDKSMPEAPKAYGENSSYSYTGMGRAMFADTEGTAPLLQKGWRNWALTKERNSLGKFGALAATFEDINATPAAATSSIASAEPAQTQANEEPAQNPEEKPATDPSKLVVIGDSRTVGMRDYASLSAGQIIAEVGKGYSWLVNNALPQAKQSGLTSYVILLGVNDLGNAESYIKKYTDLMNSGISLTIVNVGPINEAKAKQKGYKVTESQIVDFNNKIASVEGARVIDLYSYMKDNGFETTDGLHYSVSTYKNIVGFLQSNW